MGERNSAVSVHKLFTRRIFKQSKCNTYNMLADKHTLYNIKYTFIIYIINGGQTGVCLS